MIRTFTTSHISSELIIAEKSNAFKKFLQTKFLKLFLFTCFCVVTNKAAIAQWSSDSTVNTPVCTSPSDQSSTVMASDGAGGSFIAWQDGRNGDYDIYAQHINAAGIPQWQKNGKAIRIAGGDQGNLDIVADGDGGAIITWSDAPASNDNKFIGAQRINAAGEVQWSANGIPVNTPDTLNIFAVVTDGDGGAIITWTNYHPHIGTDSMRTQHINSAGIKQLGINGIGIPINYDQIIDISMIPDDKGGAIISYEGDDNLYAQRTDAAGVSQWTPKGVFISSVTGLRGGSNFITTDGAGGAIITYTNSDDIYAQHVNATGTKQWTNNGVVICNAANVQFNPLIISDDAGGAIITWLDARNNNYDIYAQRINSEGVPQWQQNGTSIFTSVGTQYLSLVSDDEGGAIIILGNGDIYAQHINMQGINQWANNGIAVSTALHSQQDPVMVSDGAGGAIIAWIDDRSSNNNSDNDIYAQNVKADGTLGCVIPAITTQPLALQTVCKNTAPANLTLTATGEDLTYQWYTDDDSVGFNGNAVNGETKTSFTPVTNTADTFFYYVIVTNRCGDNDTSGYARVIVRDLPVITALSGDNGTITPDGTTTIDCSGAQTYIITPNSCYHIADVLIDNVSNAGAVNSGSYTFDNVQANHTIAVTFAINQNTITASSGDNGTITPDGTTTIDCSGAQTYIITPNSCYHIADVSIDGISNLDAVNSGSYTFDDVKANHTIAVTFAIHQNTITASSGDNGTITPDGATTINCSSAQTYTITPNSCYHIADVLIDNVSNASAVSRGSYTFNNVQSNHTISASFAANSLPDAGTISGTSSICARSNTTFTDNISGGIWSSNNTSVADVNASTGAVTGIALGTATIKYTVTGSCGSQYTTKDISVVNAPNAGTIYGSFAICIGSTSIFTSSGDRGGVWSSSNAAVAKIDASTGMITGKKAGLAIIKYTVSSSCGSKYTSAMVTVIPNAMVLIAPIGSPFTRLTDASCSYTVGESEFMPFAVSICDVPVLSYALTGATTGSGISLSGVKLNKGKTTIKWKATAGSLTTNISIVVNVKDIQPPYITCKPGVTKNISGSAYTVSGSEFDATASDNCGTPSLMYSLSGATVVPFLSSNTSLAGKHLNAGTTKINWKATDDSHNVSVCTTVVNIKKSKSSGSYNSTIAVQPDSKILRSVKLNVLAMPNPSTSKFTLVINSSGTDKINILVYDLAGRKIEQKVNIEPTSTVQLGDSYFPGMYIVEIMQGKEVVHLKLIKAE